MAFFVVCWNPDTSATLENRPLRNTAFHSSESSNPSDSTKRKSMRAQAFMLFLFVLHSRSHSLSFQSESGEREWGKIPVRSSNSVSLFGEGLRERIKLKSPSSTNFIRFSEIYSGSIPSCSEGVVFQFFLLVLVDMLTITFKTRYAFYQTANHNASWKNCSFFRE